MTQTVTLPDDGESVGRLLRPAGGFRLAESGSLARLVALGEPEPRPWPREDGGWLREFATLHEAKPEAIRRFASQYGWLRSRVLEEPVTDWRVHAQSAADLLALIEAADALSNPKTAGEMHRHRVLEHFAFGPPGNRSPWWVGPSRQSPEASRLTDRVTWEWSGVTAGEGDQALGFHYGIYAQLIPFPVARGPRFGAALTTAPPSELAALTRAGVAYALQGCLRTASHGVLTLSLGLRVAPDSLLGAVYLGLARHLFRRKGLWRKCPGCGAGFLANVPQQRYCAPRCADAHRQRRKRQATAEAASS